MENLLTTGKRFTHIGRLWGLVVPQAIRATERLSSMKRDHKAHCPLDPSKGTDEKRGPKYLSPVLLPMRERALIDFGEKKWLLQNTKILNDG